MMKGFIHEGFNGFYKYQEIARAENFAIRLNGGMVSIPSKIDDRKDDSVPCVYVIHQPDSELKTWGLPKKEMSLVGTIDFFDNNGNSIWHWNGGADVYTKEGSLYFVLRW